MCNMRLKNPLQGVWIVSTFLALFSFVAFAQPTIPLDVVDEAYEYGGGYIDIGATATVQELSLTDTQNNGLDIHINKIIVALGPGNTASASDIDSIRVSGTGLDESASVSSFPVTVCSGIDYVIPDGGSDTLWVEVTVAAGATHGAILELQTWVVYTEGGTGDDYSGRATDGAPETLGEGPAPTAAVFRVTSEGDVLADGPYYGLAFVTGAADVAEWISISEPVEPGDVLELDPENLGHYRKSRGPCSDLIAGVVSTNPGFVLGAKTPSSSASGFGLWTMDLGPWTESSALVALIGIVPVKVTDEGGPIRPGDLLVSSSTPGYAMRWDQESDSPVCSFVGKALESLTDESGLILVLLMAH